MNESLRPQPGSGSIQRSSRATTTPQGGGAMIHVKADPKKLVLPIAFRCPVCSEEVRLSPQNGSATLPSAFCKCIHVVLITCSHLKSVLNQSTPTQLREYQQKQVLM